MSWRLRVESDVFIVTLPGYDAFTAGHDGRSFDGFACSPFRFSTSQFSGSNGSGGNFNTTRALGKVFETRPFIMSQILIDGGEWWHLPGFMDSQVTIATHDAGSTRLFVKVVADTSTVSYQVYRQGGGSYQIRYSVFDFRIGYG